VPPVGSTWLPADARRLLGPVVVAIFHSLPAAAVAGVPLRAVGTPDGRTDRDRPAATASII